MSTTPSIAESLAQIAATLEHIDDRLYGIELAISSPVPWEVRVR